VSKSHILSQNKAQVAINERRQLNRIPRILVHVYPDLRASSPSYTRFDSRRGWPQRHFNNLLLPDDGLAHPQSPYDLAEDFFTEKAG